MIRTIAKNTIAGIMVSYTIFTSPSNLFFFHLLGIVPPPQQRVFPILDRLQLLPSSPISPKWYLFPKRLFSFQGTDWKSFPACPISGWGAPLLYCVPILPRPRHAVKYYFELLLCIYMYIGVYFVGVHFKPFCITIFYVNALYGVFRPSA